MEKSFRPRKSLGQNFLIDDNIARKIIRAVDIQPGDLILEIGSGKGALTQYLLEQAKSVIAVEIDKRAAEILATKFRGECRDDRLHIEQGDFLLCDLLKISRKFGNRLRITGNIPYYITSPILFKVIEQRSVVHDLTMLVQLEVGKRIIAKPNTKDYGIISVFCQFYSIPKLLFKVPPTAFFPKPKITSALLRLDFSRRPVYEVLDEDIFVALVRATFGKRRKMLRNGLKYLNLEGLDASMLDFNLNLRPEQLSVGDFATLSNQISLQLNSSSLQDLRKKHSETAS